jgi:hypothetical protein
MTFEYTFKYKVDPSDENQGMKLEENRETIIVISELPENEQKPFSEWIYNQTVPLVDGKDPNDCAWRWDYDKWKRGYVESDMDWD